MPKKEESAPKFADRMNAKFGDKVNAQELFQKVEKFLGRFVCYPSEHARIAHVLWVAHAHCMDAWESTARLAALSPEPASGKTRLLEVTALLVPNPIEAVNMSVAYLFRKVGGEDGLPTILFDEIDTVFGPKAKENAWKLSRTVDSSSPSSAGRQRSLSSCAMPKRACCSTSTSTNRATWFFAMPASWGSKESYRSALARPTAPAAHGIG